MKSSTVEGISSEHSFDTTTLRDTSIFEAADDFGTKRTLHCNERYYMPSEISWMLKSLGFADVGIYGCQIGTFSRDTAPTPNDFEMLVIAKKVC
jgi:hypothetical protein